jgi:hypothetical protein
MFYSGCVVEVVVVVLLVLVLVLVLVLLVLVVVLLVLVVVLVVGSTAVVVVLVVGGTAVVVVVVVSLQHSYAGISTQLPTLGFFLLRIRLLGTILPVPSNLTKALRGRLSIEAMINNLDYICYLIF